MTQEKFNDLIEAPIGKTDDFWQRMNIKFVIARTLRLTLQYPEYAKAYFERLPKAVNENIPTPSNE
jgi:hypothetical protein